MRERFAGAIFAQPEITVTTWSSNDLSFAAVLPNAYPTYHPSSTDAALESCEIHKLDQRCWNKADAGEATKRDVKKRWKTGER